MRIVITFFACLLLVACGNLNIRPGEKPHAHRDVPPGKGVLTGSKGAFVLFRVEDNAPVQKRETEELVPNETSK